MVAHNVDKPQETQEPDLTSAESSFERFLLAEYDNVAHAHFNTVDSLPSFIKHYIAIASIPFVVGALFVDNDKLKATGLQAVIAAHPVVFPIFLTILSSIGLCVLGYVANIRFDAILYARTVNGIRQYFYDRSGLTLKHELSIRVLPKAVDVPGYMDARYFGVVVLTFMLVGTSYFGAGWTYYWYVNGWCTVGLVILIGAFAAAHWVLYAALAFHREKTYLRQ